MNLKARYGQTYRIAREEGSEKGDPYSDLIPCKFGHIYLHGPATLGVAVGHGPTAKRIAALPGVRITQDGDDGMNAIFGPESFAAVAAIVRPKRRKVFSDAQRAVLAAGRKPFKRKNDVEKAPEIDRKRDGTTTDDQRADLAA